MSTGSHYFRLKVNGPLSVLPTTIEELRGYNIRVVILMGLTGTGKSTFIETLSPGKDLGISKDSLQSVTHEVVIYRVHNLKHWDDHVILMDTPGFQDPSVSEGRIITMIVQAIKDLKSSANGIVASILYFHPITEVRMAGSRWKSIDMLQSVTASLGSQTINIVTSMWNRLPIHKTHIADERFDFLQWEMFKRSGELHMNLSKFKCSMESCLSILEGSWVAWQDNEKLADAVGAEYMALVCESLTDRIRSTQTEIQELREEKRLAQTPQDQRLLEVLCAKEKAALTNLESFHHDLFTINREVYRLTFPESRSGTPQISNMKTLRASLMKMFTGFRSS